MNYPTIPPGYTFLPSTVQVSGYQPIQAVVCVIGGTPLATAIDYDKVQDGRASEC